ncbi:SIMPL domain-containing protein [Sphingomicrobium nitratireducens]|uniref:SIMPL domain-containing protein n=1 Tax=Sphingomicrobium nitratireducens TaxID=2964666 RepID=UPI00223F4784|nr:SIMPL domain-containing protein [Sphingomicrobium nitratireducens]
MTKGDVRMKMRMLLTAGAASLLVPLGTVPAAAQGVPTVSPNATRLDIAVTGESSRVPDLAIIDAGVETRAPTARGAIEENARRMTQVLAALKKAGIAEKDVQTSSINLSPQYDYRRDEAPVLTGYSASNRVSVKFRDIAKAGDILDALVAVGANQINGPSLTIDRPEEAMAEARLDAIAKGRQRAELYARALGKRVVRLAMVSEGGGGPIIRPTAMRSMAMEDVAAAPPTPIMPGEQEVSVTLSMSFDLE